MCVAHPGRRGRRHSIQNAHSLAHGAWPENVSSPMPIARSDALPAKPARTPNMRATTPLPTLDSKAELEATLSGTLDTSVENKRSEASNHNDTSSSSLTLSDCARFAINSSTTTGYSSSSGSYSDSESEGGSDAVRVADGKSLAKALNAGGNSKGLSVDVMVSPPEDGYTDSESGSFEREPSKMRSTVSLLSGLSSDGSSAKEQNVEELRVSGKHLLRLRYVTQLVVSCAQDLRVGAVLCKPVLCFLYSGRDPNESFGIFSAKPLRLPSAKKKHKLLSPRMEKEILK